MQQLLQLYKTWCGHEPLKVEHLPKAGSNREYVRLYDENQHTVIGVVGPNQEENHSFVYLSHHFKKQGLPVPDIFAVSDDQTCYLQTDLGHTSLFQALKKGRELGGQYDSEEIELIRRTIRLLPHIQVEGAKDINFDECLSPKTFDRRSAMFDLNYFKYCFLKLTDMAYDEVLWEDDAEKMACDLAAGNGDFNTFLYRDFQARNVMLDNNRQPYFIDYQGGQRGPIFYDVASFLWQASAHYPNTLREEMITEYINELSKLTTVDEMSFRSQLQLFVLFRILQVLGAYGLRGYFERKRHFIDSIPPAIQNLRRMLLDGACTPYPYMEKVLRQLVELPKFNETSQPAGNASKSAYDGKGPLVVTIFSFSYKKGIPEDKSGNGGGYVFDCRSTHNPGRYEPYKKLTGLDEPVIKFLEEDGEILTFLDKVYQLADSHVQRYMQRGFTNLMFSFGCTGGQHRSVYSAQHLAEYLNDKYGIEIRLQHREQHISTVLPAKNQQTSF